MAHVLDPNRMHLLQDPQQEPETQAETPERVTEENKRKELGRTRPEDAWTSTAIQVSEPGI